MFLEDPTALMATSVATVLPSCQQLTSLTLCYAPATVFHQILGALPRCLVLEKLFLHHLLGLDVAALMELLANCTVTYLYLGDNMLSDLDVKAVANALGTSKLNRIDLIKNPFGPVGMNAIAEALPHCKLARLHIPDNVGKEFVLDAVPFSCVKDLDIDTCDINVHARARHAMRLQVRFQKSRRSVHLLPPIGMFLSTKLLRPRDRRGVCFFRLFAALNGVLQLAVAELWVAQKHLDELDEKEEWLSIRAQEIAVKCAVRTDDVSNYGREVLNGVKCNYKRKRVVE